MVLFSVANASASLASLLSPRRALATGACASTQSGGGRGSSVSSLRCTSVKVGSFSHGFASLKTLNIAFSNSTDCSSSSACIFLPVHLVSSTGSSDSTPTRRHSTVGSSLERSGSSGSVIMAGETKAVVPGVVIGAGRVGQALEKMSGGKDSVIRRGESVPADSTGPIYVCTRNDSLDGIVESTPVQRREDLVFLQNGMIEDWLASKGLASATQLLVYFAVAKIGQDPIDGKTDVNPEGLTAVTGKWAEAVADRLQSAGLSCKVLPPGEFRKSMLEKLIWISAFMLVGAKHPGATVGDVEDKYNDEVVRLIQELAAAAAAEKGVEFDSGLEARLCAYARSVADYPTAVKEFEWRNGWFYGISKKALEAGARDPCPLHTAWLKEVGAT